MPNEKITRVPSRYEILSELGSGGMGQVYKVRDSILDKVVVVKILNLDSAAALEQQMVRFQKEAKAVACLSHDNIVTLIDFGVSGNQSPYMVLDYFEGETLKDVIENDGALSVEDAMLVFKQVAQALIHAHARDIVHRDLKSANVLLTQQGELTVVKLFDFGVAQIMSAEKSMDVTRTHAIVGTPAYMSPEQARAEEADARCDIYSMGCLMFEALTGRMPFVSENVVELLEQHINAPVPDVSEFVETPLPQSLVSIIAKCLNKRKEDRFQTAEQLALALDSADEEVASLFGTEELDDTPPKTIANDVGRKSIAREFSFWAALLVLGVLAVSLVGFFLTPQARDENSSLTPTLFERRESSLPELVPEDNRPDLLDWSDRSDLTLASFANFKNRRLDVNGSNVDDSFMVTISKLPQLDFVNIDSTAVTASGIRKLAASSSLRDLKCGHRTITAEDIQAFVSLPQIEKLEFASCDFQDAHSLRELAAMAHLNQLKFRDSQLNVDAMRAINAIPNLSVLFLVNCNVTDEMTKEILKNKNLTYLNLDRNLNLTDKTLRDVPNATNLKTLSLLYCFNMSDDAVRQAQKLAREKTTIGFQFSTARSESFGPSVAAREVRWAELLGPHLQEFASALSQRDVNGETRMVLDLRGNEKLGPVIMKKIAERSIDEVCLDKTNVDDRCLQSLSGMKSLKSLSLLETDVTAKGLDVLATMPSLIAVNLSGRIGDDVIAAVARVKELRYLMLSRCEYLDGPGLARLSALQKLNHLDIKKVKPTAGFAKSLAQLNQLNGLTVSEAGLDDDGVKELSGLNLHWIDVSRSPITDESLKSFAKMPKLNGLVVSDCPRLSKAGLQKFVSEKGPGFKLVNVPTMNLAD